MLYQAEATAGALRAGAPGRAGRPPHEAATGAGTARRYQRWALGPKLAS